MMYESFIQSTLTKAETTAVRDAKYKEERD